VGPPLSPGQSEVTSAGYQTSAVLSARQITHEADGFTIFVEMRWWTVFVVTVTCVLAGPLPWDRDVREQEGPAEARRLQRVTPREARLDTYQLGLSLRL
jgi:hypothetical protein